MFRLPGSGRCRRIDADRAVSDPVTGDVLFAGSIGRTDLPGGDQPPMMTLAARQGAAAGRRDGRAARPRPGHDDRAGARRPTRTCADRHGWLDAPDPGAVTAWPSPPRCPASPSGCRRSGSSSSTSSTASGGPSSCNGFGSIETRAVEPLDQLLRKGEIDKEVYVLRRLHAADERGATPASGCTST